MDVDVCLESIGRDVRVLDLEGIWRERGGTASIQSGHSDSIQIARLTTKHDTCALDPS